MPTNLLTRYATLSLSIIVVLTVANCAGPAEEDSTGAVPGSSSFPAPDSGFPTPLPEPTGPLARGGTNPNPGGSPPPGGGTNPNPLPEPTGPPPGGGTNTNPGGRTVITAGPTLEDRYPQDAWGAFEKPGEEKCAPITNGNGPDVAGPDAEVDVRITGVRIADQKPQSPRVFRVFSPAPDLCRDDFKIVGSCLDDPRLSPYKGQEDDPACLIGISTDAQTGTDYTAKLVYELEAVCTTTTLRPCDDEKVRARAPSPTAPVRVTWQYTESIVACFEARPDPDNPDDPDSAPKYYTEESSNPPRCPSRTGI